MSRVASCCGCEVGEIVAGAAGCDPAIGNDGDRLKLVDLAQFALPAPAAAGEYDAAVPCEWLTPELVRAPELARAAAILAANVSRSDRRAFSWMALLFGSPNGGDKDCGPEGEYADDATTTGRAPAPTLEEIGEVPNAGGLNDATVPGDGDWESQPPGDATPLVPSCEAAAAPPPLPARNPVPLGGVAASCGVPFADWVPATVRVAAVFAVIRPPA